MKKYEGEGVLVVTAGYMDGSVRAEIFPTIEAVSESLERYKSICSPVFAMPIHGEIWLPDWSKNT